MDFRYKMKLWQIVVSFAEIWSDLLTAPDCFQTQTGDIRIAPGKIYVTMKKLREERLPWYH